MQERCILLKRTDAQPCLMRHVLPKGLKTCEKFCLFFLLKNPSSANDLKLVNFKKFERGKKKILI